MWNFRELQRLEFELEKEAELEAEKERLERELAEIKAQVWPEKKECSYVYPDNL